MANVAEVTDNDFDSAVLQATEPVLVDFWGPGCPPCRTIAPMIEELAAENADSIKVAKVNVYDSPNVAAKYGITGIPTLILFKGGEVADRFMGIQPKSRLQDAIDEAAGG